MAAPSPTIVATSGGYRAGSRTPLELHALVSHAVDRAGVSGRAPRLGYLGTANGDQQFRIAQMAEAARFGGLVHELVATGTLPQTCCTDDGAGLVFEGTHLAEVVTERDGAAGYLVRRGADGSVTEERLDARRLP